jgi:hypothetical protein
MIFIAGIGGIAERGRVGDRAIAREFDACAVCAEEVGRVAGEHRADLADL